MKKRIIALSLCLLLTGCGAAQTFETVDDLYAEPVVQRQVEVKLPKEAAQSAMSGTAGSIYLCDGYTITVQTFPSGTLDDAVRSVSGFTAQALAPIQTQQGDTDCYHCVWTAAGEGGDQVGRAVILDDGQCRYAVSVMAPAQTAGDLAETWQTVLSSVKLSTD